MLQLTPSSTVPGWKTSRRFCALSFSLSLLPAVRSAPFPPARDASAETSRGFQTEVGVYSQTMRREVTPSEADLAFNFYVPKEDLKEEPGPSSSWRGSEGSTAGGDRGRIRLDLYQVGCERGAPPLTVGAVSFLSMLDGVRDPNEAGGGGGHRRA